MTLLEQIDNDLIQAQKAKNEFVRDTLRYLKSSIKNAAINKQSDLDEAEIIAVIQKEVKQRRDAIAQFQSVNRPDLAKKEQNETELFEKYLPAQLSDEELTKIITETIQVVGATGKNDMGKVMGQVKPKVQGKADGQRISKIVMEMLSHE